MTLWTIYHPTEEPLTLATPAQLSEHVTTNAITIGGNGAESFRLYIIELARSLFGLPFPFLSPSPH